MAQSRQKSCYYFPFFARFGTLLGGVSLSALAAAFFSADVAFRFVIVLPAADAAAGRVTPGFLTICSPSLTSAIPDFRQGFRVPVLH
jgi:hypothetical protein